MKFLYPRDPAIQDELKSKLFTTFNQLSLEIYSLITAQLQDSLQRGSKLVKLATVIEGDQKAPFR